MFLKIKDPLEKNLSLRASADLYGSFSFEMVACSKIVHLM